MSTIDLIHDDLIRLILYYAAEYKPILVCVCKKWNLIFHGLPPIHCYWATSLTVWDICTHKNLQLIKNIRCRFRVAHKYYILWQCDDIVIRAESVSDTELTLSTNINRIKSHMRYWSGNSSTLTDRIKLWMSFGH